LRVRQESALNRLKTLLLRVIKNKRKMHPEKTATTECAPE